MGIARLVILGLAATLTAMPAYATCGSRGFGTTYGVGATDAVQTGYTTAPASTVTVSAWFWRHGAGGGSLGRVLDQNSATAAQTFILQDNTVVSAGTMAFGYGGTSTFGKWRWATPSSDAWHHVLVTFNASTSGNTPTVYIDGSTVSTTQETAFTAPSGVTTGTYVIGNRADGARGWNGKLADVAYWTAVLTANEAKALSQGASPLQVRPASLKIFTPLCGTQSNEPDWASRLTQTIVGTLGQPGNPVQPYPLSR
jgi:hypothetical protein